MEVFCVMCYIGGDRDEELWSIYHNSVKAYEAAEEYCDFTKDDKHTPKVFPQVVTSEEVTYSWKRDYLNPGDFFIQRMEVLE